jgi:hypothetical protein
MRRTRTPRSPRWPIVLCVLALFALPPHAGAQAPTSPARYVPPLGFRTKEFTLVRSDGWFHLFYLRENVIPNGPTERSLGHAVSRDLYTWAEQDTILPVVPGTFEATQIWAPHLVKAGGVWHLFYPGMRDEPQLGYNLAQSITEATSTDLFQWTRREAPLFDNSIFPWAYYDTTVALGRDCRDPFVWWDAAHGEWLMYVSTRPAFNPLCMVIGIAGSSDLETWTDRGYVPLTLPDVAFSDVAESPLILTRDGAPLLFMWTTDADQSLTYGTSNDAVTGWGNSRRLRDMLGHTTIGWWGAETLADGPRSYFATVYDSWIQFWDLHWTGPEDFELTAPDSLQILSTRFLPDGALPGDTAQVAVATVNGTGRSVALEYVRLRGDTADTLDAGAWGLPDSLTLGADSSAAPLVVSPYLGDGRPCLLVVRAKGAAESAPPDTLQIGVREATIEDPPPPVDEPPIEGIRPMWLPLRRQLQFVAEHAPRAWSVDVFDVRGRKLWTGHAAAGERTLTWSPAGAAGTGAGAPPGIYFARVRVGGAPVQKLKVAIY